MASSCIPIFCKPIVIDDIPYYDGGVSDSLPVQFLLDQGCDRVVAILNRAPGYRKSPEKGQHFYDRWLKDYPAIADALRVRHEKYNASLEQLEEMERDGTAVLIRPPKPLPLTTFSRRPDVALKYARRQGYLSAAREII
jgi:predicted patatin/cPLA2 family phospholipase